jgi:hypothetical protein
MYTLNQSVSKMLPQTSMIKLFDVWIIYGLFHHFVILILLILIEHLPEDCQVLSLHGGEKQIKNIKKSLKAKTQKFAKITCPLLETTFVMCYFIAASIFIRTAFTETSVIFD